jgi:hypothetical protein
MTKGPALVFALAAVATALGIAAYSKSGGYATAFKTSEFPRPLVKSEARLCPEGEAGPVGCERP